MFTDTTLAEARRFTEHNCDSTIFFFVYGELFGGSTKNTAVTARARVVLAGGMVTGAGVLETASHLHVVRQQDSMNSSANLT